jgi:hypothetical protein
MQEVLRLTYDGDKIRSKEGMDAYDVAEAIEGFADYLRSLGQVVYGQEPLERAARAKEPTFASATFVGAKCIISATDPIKPKG